MVDRTIYSPEFRRMVAKAYFTSSKSLSEIGKEFNVKMTTVHYWVRRYGPEFGHSRTIQQDFRTFQAASNTVNSMKNEHLSAAEMARRIEELEEQLKQEQMRSIVPDQMIDLAERELKISIRKKSGAKQSK